jgi:hypothetical protein
MKSSKPSYNAQGYLKQGTDDVKMKGIVSTSARSKRDQKDIYWDDTHSSQEELAKNAGRIVVKTTVHQDDEISEENSRHRSAGRSWAVDAQNSREKVSSSVERR